MEWGSLWLSETRPNTYYTIGCWFIWNPVGVLLIHRTIHMNLVVRKTPGGSHVNHPGRSLVNTTALMFHMNLRSKFSNPVGAMLILYQAHDNTYKCLHITGWVKLILYWGNWQYAVYKWILSWQSISLCVLKGTHDIKTLISIVTWANARTLFCYEVKTS